MLTATPLHSVSIFSDGSVKVAPRFRFAWDDEIEDYQYKCRTQSPGFVGPDNPPAVLRYAPAIVKEPIGDYRVNLTKDPSWRWQETVIALNGGDDQKFSYWTGPGRAQFNSTGWSQLGYLGMCGNEIHVLERVSGWVRFETLRPTDWLRARSMSIETHPCLIHRFVCVTWDAATQTTKHIESTGTARGQVVYPLVTNEGSAWIPEQMIVEM